MARISGTPVLGEIEIAYAQSQLDLYQKLICIPGSPAGLLRTVADAAEGQYEKLEK